MVTKINSMAGRRKFLKYCGVILGGAVMANPLKAMAASPSKKPNILFIFSDDHSVNTIGSYGAKTKVTPNMDRIAAEGAIFENSFCANSICQPSRATVLTGVHSHINGQTHNGGKWNGKQIIFPRLLNNKAGYQTALIGKWHMHPNPTNEFEYWKVLTGFGGQGSYFNPEFVGQDGPEQIYGYSTDLITSEAIRWLDNDRDKDKPFMLMCQFKSPHVPQLPPVRKATMFEGETLPEPDTLLDDYKNRQPYIGKHAAPLFPSLLGAIPPRGSKYKLDPSHKRNLDMMTDKQKDDWHNAYDKWSQKYYDFMDSDDAKDPVKKLKFEYQRMAKNYLRCISTIDDNVGRLLDWLEDNKLDKDTIVIYCSDQSYFVGEHGMSDKRWMYEESLRMPLIVRWPGKIKPGTKVKELVQNIDYAPTFLDIAGVDVPERMQGESLLNLMAGNEIQWRDSIYYHYYENGGHNVPRHDGIRTERYKLICYYTDDKYELFDLENDPNELKSLHDSKEHKKLKRKMVRDLKAIRKKYLVSDDIFEAPYVVKNKINR